MKSEKGDAVRIIENDCTNQLYVASILIICEEGLLELALLHCAQWAGSTAGGYSMTCMQSISEDHQVSELE